ERGAKLEPLPDTGRRGDPVDRDAGAHQVQMGLGVPEEPAAVGGVDVARLETSGASRLDDPGQPGQLHLRRDLVVFALRKVGPHALDLPAGTTDLTEG